MGVARRASGRRRRLVTSSIEHKAVLQTVEQLHRQLGFEVVRLPVDDNGIVSVEAAMEAINDETLLVSVQGANNEIGTLQPIEKLAQLARNAGAFMHCDAVQMMGKVTVNVEQLGVDLLSLSGHKFYGPKGIGVLYVRGGQSKTPLEPLLYGGGQEKNLRPGTENIPAIVGMGQAAELSLIKLSDEGKRMGALRELLERSLTQSTTDIVINGRAAPRLPNTTSLTISGIDADAMLLNMPRLMMGTGSACTSGAVEPSHVLTAIGLTRSQASSTIRLSIGIPTTLEEIEIAWKIIVETCELLSG